MSLELSDANLTEILEDLKVMSTETMTGNNRDSGEVTAVTLHLTSFVYDPGFNRFVFVGLRAGNQLLKIYSSLGLNFKTSKPIDAQTAGGQITIEKVVRVPLIWDRVVHLIEVLIMEDTAWKKPAARLSGEKLNRLIGVNAVRDREDLVAHGTSTPFLKIKTQSRGEMILPSSKESKLTLPVFTFMEKKNVAEFKSRLNEVLGSPASRASADSVCFNQVSSSLNQVSDSSISNVVINFNNNDSGSKNNIQRKSRSKSKVSTIQKAKCIKLNSSIIDSAKDSNSKAVKKVKFSSTNPKVLEINTTSSTKPISALNKNSITVISRNPPGENNSVLPIGATSSSSRV